MDSAPQIGPHAAAVAAQSPHTENPDRTCILRRTAVQPGLTYNAFRNIQTMNDDATANANSDSSSSGSEDFSSSTTSEPESAREEMETDPSEIETSNPHDKDELEEPQRQSLSVDVLRSALQAVPTDLDFDTWTRIIAAVGNGAPDRDTAESLLKEWSEEQHPGEYSRVLNETSDGDTTVAALLGIAKQHGWNPEELPVDDGPASENERSARECTFSDIEAIFASLNDDASSREVERQALKLVEEVSHLSDVEIQRAKLLLEEAGARAKEVREWVSLVKSNKKERVKREAEAREMDRGPADLKGGEVTSWIVERLLERDTFAVDKGGALFYYKDGRYCNPGDKGGKKYLKEKVIELLEEEGVEKRSTTYWYDEVQDRVETTSQVLRESPPRDRICLKNGIYHLGTGELEPLSPEWRSTDQVPIIYDPDAVGTAYRDFFESMMPKDGGATLGFEFVAQFFQRASGRRRAYYLTGPPNSGKSTLIKILSRTLLGASASHFSLQELEDKHNRACLHSKMLNVCADLPAKPLSGISTFKRITGGDSIAARHMYEGPFSFEPDCHLLFSGNGPIIAPEAGQAFWDRWTVIPCESDFSKGSGNHIPMEELTARLNDPQEKSALLNEVLPIIREGKEVTETPSMKAALDQMRQANESGDEVGNSSS